MKKSIKKGGELLFMSFVPNENNVTEMKIYKTKEYGMFLIIPGNREINRFDVQRLAEKISHRDKLNVNPIIVNEHFGIVDGQHRLEAAKMQEVFIYYMIDKDATLEDVQMLNTFVRPWSLPHYLSCYIQGGGERAYHYQKLSEFVASYGLSPSRSASLLMGINSVSNKGMYSIIKQGDFRVRDEEKAKEIARELIALQEMSKGSVARSRIFIAALSAMRKIVDINEMIILMRKNRKMLSQQSTITGYKEHLEEIWNSMNKNKIIIR